MKTLRKHSEKLFRTAPHVVSSSDQQYFLQAPITTIEGSYRTMIDAVEHYCSAFKKANDSLVGNDGFVGQYIEEILHGLRGLESAQGRFDGGTLDKTILEIAETHALNIE